MSKSTKNTKKPKDHKAKIAGLYSLAIALAELATVYILATQDNAVLFPIAIVLGIDASQRFVQAFVK